MKKIAYLLHRFPGITDTFIRREILSLQAAGTAVRIISVWRPTECETTPDILKQWSSHTEFLLPRSIVSIGLSILSSAARSPRRFLSSIRLALSLSRPGVRGHIYQLFYFVQAVLAAEALRENGIDHVHNHIGDHSGTVTMLAARLAGTDYSITFHGWPVFFDSKYSRVKEKVSGAQFTRSIGYFCRSQLMMFSECEDTARFEIAHCGVAVGKYRYRPPRETVKILFCATRLSPEKGLPCIILALSLLRKAGYDLALRLGGDGPSKGRLQELAAQLGVSEQVHFLGFLSEDEIVRELDSADLFVLPSFVEGIPVSAMEALAVGVPVIATNIAGTSELIEDGRTGLLVRPSDPKAFADAIVRMISDYSFRLRVSECGRQKVVDEFDVDRETEKLRRRLLERSGRPA